jgi:hypothetical protein
MRLPLPVWQAGVIKFVVAAPFYRIDVQACHGPSHLMRSR